MQGDTSFDWVLTIVVSIGGVAVGIACIVVGTTYWDMSWMLLLAVLILFFSVRVLSFYPKELLGRIRGDINEKQEILVELSIWLVITAISACVRIFM